MRIAFVSPMPPAKSGIADYSAALVAPLRDLAAVDVFEQQPPGFRASAYDEIIYQIGNNGFHAGAFEMALEHPGLVVLHEANLHHLITDLTIRRNRWDLYLAECEYDGGPAALEFAKRVQRLEVGPDYDGVPMLRRLLERSRGVIVHSRFCAGAVRAGQYLGPLSVIPHGAWISDTPAMPWRYRLGLDETAPLIGVFGFLKPYKRIAESLRAFRRLLRFEPRARMILVGETHPDFPLKEMIRGLNLGPFVRLLGFTTEEDFTGYMAACDIVLNLRFPTVGESSGSLLRALGLGRACVVSGVGSFAELPDSVCLKVPVGSAEEDTLFEYLNLLVTRPRLARVLGEEARAWVRRECSWPKVAERYVQFAEAVHAGRHQEPSLALPETPEAAAPPPEITAEYIIGWAADDEARNYVDIHKDRLVRTLELTPPGGPDDHILEMGSYLQITPALKTKLGYGHVHGCYYGPLGRIDHRQAASQGGEEFACDIDHFDAEKDIYPYADGYFAAVICGELIEHLFSDPMHMMAEINRVLRPGGTLVLTTPNIASMRALHAILQGYHPGFFPAYLKPGETNDARHNREYTPKEIWQLFYYAGFEMMNLETGEFRDDPRPHHIWIEHLLERYQLPAEWRGDGIYAVGKKVAAVRERFPAFLYG